MFRSIGILATFLLIASIPGSANGSAIAGISQRSFDSSLEQTNSNLTTRPYWYFECFETGPKVNYKSCTPLFDRVSNPRLYPSFNSPKTWKGPGPSVLHEDGGCKIEILYPRGGQDTFSEWWIIDSAKWILERCVVSGMGGQKVSGSRDTPILDSHPFPCVDEAFWMSVLYACSRGLTKADQYFNTQQIGGLGFGLVVEGPSEDYAQHVQNMTTQGVSGGEDVATS